MIEGKLRLATVEGEGKQFVAESGSGHALVMDDPNGHTGPKPIELALLALGGCTAFDVIGILRKKRQKALIAAITNFVASPTGAKVAAWAPHVFLTEGAILLTSSRTAPFASPIKVDLENTDRPIQLDPTYAKRMQDLANEDDTWVWSFNDVKGLLDSATEVLKTLDGGHDG